MVPKGWHKHQLSAICTLQNGHSFKPHEWDTEGLPIIRIQNLNGSTNFNYYAGEADDRWIVETGQLLFSWAGTRGVSFGPFIWSGSKGVLNQHIYKVYPKRVDAAWLYLTLKWITHHIEAQAHGFKATLLHVQKKDIEEQYVLVPPFPEQRKIAQILSTWDKAIATTERLLANKQQQKKALMQRLLTGRQRFAGFEGEWQRVHIKDCTTCLDNKRVPLNSEQRNAMKGPIPYWGANSVMDYVNDFIFDDDLVLLAEDGGYFDEFETRPIANLSRGKCWVNNHAHILKTRHNCLTEWLYYSLVHKNILAYVNTGTRAKLNKSDMLMIPILLPTIAEQRKIVSILAQADNELGSLSARLENLKLQKKALMQQLLTGKRRVKVDEAAA